MYSLELPDGTRMPALGLGTWKSDAGMVTNAVRCAIRAGYRHIDCAPVYGNETEVGEAISAAIDAGEVSRDSLWITSKLWNDSHAPADVRPALQRTLEDLGLEYLDLFLIHWPIAHRRGVTIPNSARDLIPLDTLPLGDTWAAMESVVESGLARHIGVSNFSVAKLKQLARVAKRRPGVVQVELHPYLQQNDLVRYCNENDIAVTAYSPLGSRDRSPLIKAADEPDLLNDPTVRTIAQELGASAAQVLIAWSLQRRLAVIPKSVTPARIVENLVAAELRFGAEQMEAIARLERAQRYVTGRFFELPGGPYDYANIWDEGR